MPEYEHHTVIPGDRWRCERTRKIARFIFWEGAGPCPPGEDLCEHCSDWTVGSRLAELNEKRKREAGDV